MTDPTHIAVLVTVLIWLLGLSFWAGRLAERVHHHDRWREEARADFAKIFERLEEIVERLPLHRGVYRGREDSTS